MNKLLVVVLGIVTVAMSQFTSAQEGTRGTPAEFYGCTWQDGKGMADLVKVAGKFSQWADKQDSKYSAWILTPQFHTDVGFEVGWLGGWPSAADMGASLDGWESGGRELAADFTAVMDCSGSFVYVNTRHRRHTGLLTRVAAGHVELTVHTDSRELREVQRNPFATEAERKLVAAGRRMLIPRDDITTVEAINEGTT